MYELNGERYEYLADIQDLLYSPRSLLTVNDIVTVINDDGSKTEETLSTLIVNEVWSTIKIECDTGKLAKWQNK